MNMPTVDTGLSVLATSEGIPSPTPPQTPETLKRALLSLIDEATDPEVQIEASRLITCVADVGSTVDASDVALIESGISALRAKNANIRVAKFVRNRLEIKRRNQKSGLVPWLSRKLGDSAVYAMLIGVACSALLWLVAFGAVVSISDLVSELTKTSTIFPTREASPLAFAAFVGGLVSILSRVDQFAKLYIFDPFLVFVNSLLKPLIGTVLAVTIYAILESKIIQINAIVFEFEGGLNEYRHMFWAFGFVAGFSERLAGDFIARAESVVGRPGEKKEPAP